MTPRARRAPIAPLFALLTAFAVSGCTSKKAPPAEPPGDAPPAETASAAEKAAAPPTKAAPATGPDPRTAAQFAAAWTKLREVPDEQQSVAGKAMRDDWHGRTYTWTGYAVPGLCQPARKRCAVHVFERRSTPVEARLDGYFPQVQFTDAGYAALTAACKGKTGCVITFAGRLAETETDPAEPLRLHFADATFVEGRDPKADEQWFGARADASPPKKAPNAKVRAGTPTKSPIKLRPRTF